MIKLGSLFVVILEGLAAPFPQSSALKIVQTKKRSSKLGVFRIELFIRDPGGITFGFPLNSHVRIGSSHRLKWRYDFSFQSIYISLTLLTFLETKNPLL
jgi:hypothetical protein